MRASRLGSMTGRGLILCVLVASVALAAGCGSNSGVNKAGHKTAAKPLILTLANHEQGPSDVQAWADAVQRLSNGTLIIRVVNNWRREEHDYDRSTIGDVQAGRVALAKIGARAYDTVGVTSFQPLVAPFLIDSLSLEDRVLTSPVEQPALAGTARLGLVGLALLSGELRMQVGVSRSLLTPSDFRGARIAVREGKVTAATFRALGANPVELPPGSSLSSVDGAELSADVLKAVPDLRSVKELETNVVLWPKPITIVINAKTFTMLTPSQQNALRQAARAAFAAQARQVAETENGARRVLCGAGLSFVRANGSQLGGLRAAVQPVYNQIDRGAGNADAIRKIEAMKGSAPPDVPSCSPKDQSANGASGPTPIDGTYRTSFSKQELASSHYLLDAGEINDGNWGTMTLRFHNGRMALSQENANAASTSTGRYTVSGNTIRLEIEQTGEIFAFHWTLYRDTLKFQRDVKLGVGPTPYLVKPWQRVGS